MAIIHQIPDESIAVVNYLLELLVYILWDEDSNRRTKGEYESERLDGRIRNKLIIKALTYSILLISPGSNIPPSPCNIRELSIPGLHFLEARPENPLVSLEIREWKTMQ